MTKKIFASLLVALTVIPAVAQLKNPYGYLYCHMSRRGEWTAFALSRDGVHWRDLRPAGRPERRQRGVRHREALRHRGGRA